MADKGIQVLLPKNNTALKYKESTMAKSSRFDLSFKLELVTKYGKMKEKIESTNRKQKKKTVYPRITEYMNM